MLIQTLLSAGETYRREHPEKVDAKTLALEALRRIQAIFPGEPDRRRSTIDFARDVLSIQPSEGLSDDLALLSLMMRGGRISTDIQALIDDFENMTDDQRAELDAIQSRHFSDLAEFFGRIGNDATADLFSRHDRPVDPEFSGGPPPFSGDPYDLTVVRGIGPSTARHLVEMGVRALSELANLSDERVSELDHKLRMLPGTSSRDWRTQALRILGRS